MSENLHKPDCICVTCEDARNATVTVDRQEWERMKASFQSLIDWVDYDKEKDEPSSECWCTDTGTEWGDGILRCAQCKAKEAIKKMNSLTPSNAVESQNTQ